MADPFLGEIKLGAWNFAPRGWALCNGALMSIGQNAALFALLGTQYGGNGSTTFALPDLRGRVAMHLGQNPQGTVLGSPSYSLTVGETPLHTHQLNGASVAGTSLSVASAPWLAGIAAGYGPLPTDSTATTMLPTSVSSVGSGAGHENRQPFTCLNYVIATAGIFPSRN
jgi:microcystin-dependent protein